MVARIFTSILRISPKVRKCLWKWWYQRLAKQGQETGWTFMNYGYTPLNGSSPKLDLEEKDENDRHFIQLYHHAASTVPIENKNVLEVGSGRGGGTSFVARYHSPAEMTGLDFSPTAISLSQKMHGDIPNLTFVHGDAEKLPFEDHNFDVVINVESSHCYGNMDAFVKEVSRVLKPGGYFSWVDLRGTDMIQALEVALSHPQLQLVRNEIITENVIQALDEIHERKIDLIREYIPKWIQPAFKDFAGVKNSKIYNAFKDGSAIYLAKAYQKTRH